MFLCKYLKVLGPHVEDIPQEVKENPVVKEEKREIVECFKEDVDETVILARLRTQAKVLQELDGELPESVDKFLTSIDKTEKPQKIPSLSLVAGYGEESDDEEEQPEDNEHKKQKSLFPIPETATVPENSNAESTLFPVTKPIDISQFASAKEEEKVVPATKEETDESVDTKLFKRKKRIAFDVLPTMAEKKTKVNDSNVEERRGFGFKNESDSNSTDSKMFINFTRGGVAFVKPEDSVQHDPVQNDDKKEEKEVDKNLEELKEMVKEKVKFLCEGKNEVSAVQTMWIQLQVS